MGIPECRFQSASPLEIGCKIIPYFIIIFTILLSHRTGSEQIIQLLYDEPPPWYFPVRQSLGTVLLDLGRADEAEAVFRKDLFKNAENPWSLFGLGESLKMQGKMDQVANVMKRFNRAWSRADVELTRPEF